MFSWQAMRDKEVKDLTGLESSVVVQDADAGAGTEEQSSLAKVGDTDPEAVGTSQPSTSS
jgi:hypothetical protein